MATNFPNSPSNGDTHAGFTYNSTAGAWKSSGTAPTNISVSDAAPSSPTSGQLWWNSTTNKLYIYYTDANSSQWIQASTPGATGATGAAGPSGSINILTDVDTATAAPSTGDLLQWNGTNWVPYTHTNGITEVDQWRITADLTSDEDPVSSNLARVNDASFAKIGTGMSVSSGVWTFPNTGLWKVSFNVSCYFTVTDLAIRAIIQASSDSGINWDNLANFKMGADYSTNNFSHGAGESFINVTNTSTIKLRFSLTSISSGNQVIGEADRSDTYFSFIRLGDSQ